MARASRRVGVIDFQKAVNSLFVKYGEDVIEVIDDTLNEVGRETAEDLKAVTTWHYTYSNSPYSKDWTWEVVPKKRLVRKLTVYNVDHYQLTHLLESGHAKWLWGKETGGSVQKYTHIEPIADKAYEHMENAVVRRLKEIGE